MQVLDKEANYNVVIDSGSGESITISDVISFECQMDRTTVPTFTEIHQPTLLTQFLCLWRLLAVSQTQ